MGTDPASVRNAVEGYIEAFARRDVEKALEFFSEDAEMTEPPGTFKGKEGVRQLLERHLGGTARGQASLVGKLYAEGPFSVRERASGLGSIDVTVQYRPVSL
jgi:ketosteroid isomerase-like protein